MKVAAITGAGRGIGKQTAELLRQRGYAIARIDLNPIKKAPDETPGGDVLDLHGDVTDEGFVEHCRQRVAARWGRLDALVNNAGISLIVPAERTATADWRRVLDVNLTAPFLLCRAFGEMMLGQAMGSIVNVASIAGLAAVSDRAAYNTSKHGLVGLTRTLAAEWGGRGVRCNAVCPGWVKTEMDSADQGAGAYTSADIEARVPMGRFATAMDVAEAIAFLVDPERSGFVNGHCLVVDGGWTVDASWESLRLGHR